MRMRMRANGGRDGARLAFTQTGPGSSSARVFSQAQARRLGRLDSPGERLGTAPCAMKSMYTLLNSNAIQCSTLLELIY